MYVGKYTHIYVCLFAIIQVCKFAHFQACTFTCMKDCKYGRLQVRKYARMQICMYACMHIRIYANIPRFKDSCMYICTSAHNACMQVWKSKHQMLQVVNIESMKVCRNRNAHNMWSYCLAKLSMQVSMYVSMHFCKYAK